MHDQPQRRAITGLVAAAAAAAAFAVWLYWPVRNGGLLADELVLMSYLTVPGDAGMQVDWQRVLDDFHGPWAFGYGGYYRPLVTSSWALAFWLTDGAAWAFHSLSIGLLAACVFAWARLFGELFGAGAALCGGLLFAAHPAMHEPVCWPCTCADLLVLTFCAWSCLCFVRHLRGGRRRDLVVAMLAAVLALLSKENGILLAIWLPLLDLAVRSRDVPFIARVRRQLPFATLWLSYLAWRWVVLAAPLGDAGPALGVEAWSHWSRLQVAKLQACVLPMGGRMPAATPWAMALLLAWLLAGTLAIRANRRWLWLALVWIVVSFLPVQWEAVMPQLGKSRYVTPALAGFVLWAAAVVGSAHLPRWSRLAGAALLAVAVGCLAVGTRTIQDDYRLAWQQMRSLREQIAAAAEPATTAAPLVMLAGLRFDDEISFLPSEMAFALAERPLAANDRPFVSLGHVAQTSVGPELSAGDVTVWRAWWQHGASLFHWSAGAHGTGVTMVPSPQDTPTAVLDAAAIGFVVRGGMASPWPIGGIEVVADTSFEGGDLIWRTANGHAGTVPIPAPRYLGDRWCAAVDLTANGDFLVFGGLAGITGFEAHLSPAAVVAQSLRVQAPSPPAPLPRPMHGERLALHELPSRLAWQALPADAEPDSTALVLMNRALAIRIPLRPGERLVVPALAQRWLAQFDRQVREPGLHYCYLEARAGGRRWQSAIDWFERKR